MSQNKIIVAIVTGAFDQLDVIMGLHNAWKEYVHDMEHRFHDAVPSTEQFLSNTTIGGVDDQVMINSFSKSMGLPVAELETSCHASIAVDELVEGTFQVHLALRCMPDLHIKEAMLCC